MSFRLRDSGLLALLRGRQLRSRRNNAPGRIFRPPTYQLLKFVVVDTHSLNVPGVQGVVFLIVLSDNVFLDQFFLRLRPHPLNQGLGAALLSEKVKVAGLCIREHRFVPIRSEGQAVDRSPHGRCLRRRHNRHRLVFQEVEAWPVRLAFRVFVLGTPLLIRRVTAVAGKKGSRRADKVSDAAHRAVDCVNNILLNDLAGLVWLRTKEPLPIRVLVGKTADLVSHLDVTLEDHMARLVTVVTVGHPGRHTALTIGTGPWLAVATALEDHGGHFLNLLRVDTSPADTKAI